MLSATNELVMRSSPEEARTVNFEAAHTRRVMSFSTPELHSVCSDTATTKKKNATLHSTQTSLQIQQCYMKMKVSFVNCIKAHQFQASKHGQDTHMVLENAKKHIKFYFIDHFQGNHVSRIVARKKTGFIKCKCL